MNKVRFVVIGIGNMGSSEFRWLAKGDVKNAVLTGVCDIDPKKLEMVKGELGDTIKYFNNIDELLEETDVCDAVLIAVPHYDHTVLAKKAFAKGLNVLVEKPAGVYTKAVREMNEAAKKSGKVFGIMYNQRTNPLYAKVRELIQSGELGELRRINWIITDWYRSQSYYDSGTWRASWAGEGGGVLINQAPHQLDLWQWITGMMPTKIHSFLGYGKMHDIEVEDMVTAYAEYENGATGVFITTTGETPGTNRLEIVGDCGKIVVENEKMKFSRNRVSEREFNATYKGGFGAPECWDVQVPVKGEETGHVGILENFSKAVLTGSELLAPGEEGVKGLEISNAIHLSSWLEQSVTLPIDEDKYYELLQEKIKTSRYEKKTNEGILLDVSGTH